MELCLTTKLRRRPCVWRDINSFIRTVSRRETTRTRKRSGSERETETRRRRRHHRHRACVRRCVTGSRDPSRLQSALLTHTSESEKPTLRALKRSLGRTRTGKKIQSRLCGDGDGGGWCWWWRRHGGPPFRGPLNIKGRNESQEAYTAGSEKSDEFNLALPYSVCRLRSFSKRDPFSKSSTSAKKTPTTRNLHVDSAEPS